MPSLSRGKGSPLGAIGTVRSFVNIVRELSFEEVRNEAERAPRILVVAPEESTASQIATLLTGEDHSTRVATRALDASATDVGLYDVAVVFDPAGSSALERWRESAETTVPATPIFATPKSGLTSEREAAELRVRILSRLPERAPAFGRAFVAFRSAAVKLVIDETARANAQFALVSNIPAALPVIGSLAAAGADFLILTKNQVMMIYKLAAIHGRDMRDQTGIIREMAPVVGAGLFWRTLAREAASFIPFAAGTIPKVAIAFTGTIAAGRGADFYYRFGRKPTREQMAIYYRQAAETLKKLPLPSGANGRGIPDSSSVADAP